MKKPRSEKLTDSINTPVTPGLKRRVVAVAKAKSIALTHVAREYIAKGVEQDEQSVTSASK